METFIIVMLVITSITCVTFIIERGLALREKKVVPQPLIDAVLNYKSGRDLQMVKSVCAQNRSPLSRLLLFATDHLDQPKNETSSLLETRARYEITKLERGLVILEIIVGIAPLMGLVGTIYGLIILFANMKGGSSVENAQFASGISTALNATLMGLMIAIPALISWSYYSRKVETFAVSMEGLCEEFLRKHYRTEAAFPNGEPAVVVAPRVAASSESH
jgi:biopolymer transport protein ExbB